MSEFRYNPLMVNVWIKEIGPINSRLIEKIAKGGPAWGREPYGHELGILNAYYGAMDRRNILSPGYIQNTLHFFEWMSSLSEGQFPPVERIKGRVGPLFLGDGDKKAIKDQIDKLKKASFLSDRSNTMSLVQFLIRSTDKLEESQILVGDFDVFNSGQEIFS